MTTQLSLYNGALYNLKERPLASLTENREPRRALDAQWDGAIAACLQQGFWKFAMRTAKFVPNVGFVASFGFKNQFTQPTDFVRLYAMCQDEYFNVPLNQYTEEAGNWYADLNPIYVSYVSDDVSYGSNMAMWPQTFVNAVQLYLAVKAGPRISGEDLSGMKKELVQAFRDARSKDALEEGTKFLPQGNWSRARQKGSINRRDGGNRGSLLG
jgi:hypothetical protein